MLCVLTKTSPNVLGVKKSRTTVNALSGGLVGLRPPSPDSFTGVF
ncbi:hypothetical protein RKE29_14625 [Streptomyces sp. B1866]|nr:hypothetical protein [Streptomyces sp. B1866]MDT3397863.1 hypothetical protein [Streptomyces sp. B1866]